ncbi:MAG: hypothetical protein ACUVRC_03780 [Desulfotomaculales bacterium]
MACVLAYLLERVIDVKLQEAKIELTAQKALREFSKLKVADVDLGGTICRYRTELTDSRSRSLTLLRLIFQQK